MQQQRASVRQRSFLGARVVYGRRHLSLDCMVRDLSDDGARLVFGECPAVGDHFDLVVATKSSQRHATVVWRAGREVGVVLSAVREEADVSVDILQHVRQLERSNAQLRSRIDALHVSM